MCVIALSQTFAAQYNPPLIFFGIHSRGAVKHCITPVQFGAIFVVHFF
jgi:hypothetical protein